MPQAGFQADADTAMLDETLIQLGVRWRFLRAKGLDYAEEMASYERALEQAMARDGGSTAVTIAPQPVDPNRVNIPAGSEPDTGIPGRSAGRSPRSSWC